MKNANGEWIGFGLGDVDPKVAEIQKFLARKYSQRAGWLVATGTYDQATADIVAGLQEYYKVPVTPDKVGVFNYDTQVATGFYKPAPKNLPIMISVEGHLSNMFAGPVADTATVLENEGILRHQPTGYNNGAIPFDNGSGENEVVRFLNSPVLDNGTPFPEGTPFVLSGFSQGAIIIFDLYVNHLQPGQDLYWRAKDLVCVLQYGPPCRQDGSVAPWAQPWVKNANTHGLDPYRRFGLPNMPAGPNHPWMDVWREGDIFAQNGDDKASQVKAAVYQAVARADFFSDPFSLCAQIADLFTVPIDEVIGIFWAIVSGIGFAASKPNPHYDPYDISGGINWVRDQVLNFKRVVV